jgi:hypothetical protein
VFVRRYRDAGEPIHQTRQKATWGSRYTQPVSLYNPNNPDTVFGRMKSRDLNDYEHPSDPRTNKVNPNRYPHDSQSAGGRSRSTFGQPQNGNSFGSRNNGAAIFNGRGGDRGRERNRSGQVGGNDFDDDDMDEDFGGKFKRFNSKDGTKFGSSNAVSSRRRRDDDVYDY